MKEEILKAINELPKVKADNPISAMNGINVNDLMDAVERFDKVPTYHKLLEENKSLQSQLKAKEEVVTKFKQWLEEQKDFIKNIPVFTSDIANNHLGMIGAYNNSLDKIQELEILSKGENK